MGLLNPILSVVTMTMWRKTCLVSLHCSYSEQYSISTEHDWWLCKMPLRQTVQWWWAPLGDTCRIHSSSTEPQTTALWGIQLTLFKYWDNGDSETLQHTRLYTLCVERKTLSKRNIFHTKICTILHSYTVHSTHTTQEVPNLHRSKSLTPEDITIEYLFWLIWSLAPYIQQTLAHPFNLYIHIYRCLQFFFFSFRLIFWFANPNSRWFRITAPSINPD